MSLVIFWTCFGSSLLVLAVFERIAHAALSLLSGKRDVRAGLLIGSFLNFVSVVWTSLIAALVRSAGFIGWMVFWYALFYGLTSFWFVLYEDYPDVVIHLVNFYNKRVGRFLHGYLFVPFDLLNALLKAFLPLYNGFVWVVRGLVTKGILPVVWDELDLVVDFSAALLGFAKNICVSLVDFVLDLNCASDVTCIERPAVFDVVTPMSNLRDMAVVTSRVTSVVCSTVATPFDWVIYPLVDTRFARGLHAIVNAVLHLVVHVPRTATKRCNAYGMNGTHLDVLMCTPDLEPFFDHAVSGMRELGGTVDNWLGVGAAMARRTLTGLPDDCVVKSASPDAFRGDMLGGVQTVVGLTDWLTAASNGTYAYFWGQVTSDVAFRGWPEPVDVRFGVAAVSFDEAGEVEVSSVTQGQRPATRQTTSLMGCRCLDTSQGVVVRCSVLPMQGAALSSTHSFDVKFQDATWAGEMQCRGVEVSVRSVRWPVRRYEGKSVPFSAGYMDLPATDCMSRGSCESVDATVWLVPRCDVLRPEQCSDAAVGTSCFPFCMAARISGGRNANPIFVNAEMWRTGRQLLLRDCALSAGVPSASTFLQPQKAKVTTAGYAKTALSGAAGGSQLFVSGAGDGSECVSGANLVSWVPLGNASKADPRSVPAYMRRRGQPFAIAGDAVLMEFRGSDGASTVEVDRLSGNQRDVYSLVPGWAGLPTAPKFLVPIEELSADERGRVVVPLDFVTTRVQSTSSRNFVFYAVSPDLRIFQAYLDYCRDSSALPQAQYMMLSSYSALRVYRVRAYCQETCETGDLASQFTFDGFSDGKFNSDEFPQDCSRVYNASVDALEYVNEQNLAVTVQVADRTYNPLERSGSNSSYVTYWLNPQTMRIKRGSMWPMDVPSSLTAGLCAVGDGVPHLGTLGAELVVAGLHVMNKGIGAFLYAPGILSFWRGGGRCPLDSRGHSVLASCGQSVFSLDDFFDSLDTASAVFWGIPGWVAEQMEQGKTAEYSQVSELLRGFGAYGRGAVGITAVQGGVLSLLNTPLPEELTGVYALVRQPGALGGAAKVIGGASSWARFTSRFFVSVGSSVAQKFAVDGVLDMGDIWRDIINTLYDQRPFFKATVTDRGISACLGLQMMMGGANPPGKLLYHSCLSSVRLVDGAMDVMLHAFVDAPMVKCVCKDSEGKVVSAYAREFCVSKAPKTLQPTLLGMIAASEGLIGGNSLLCPAVISYTREALGASMRPYFSTVFSSLDALGDSIDYVLSGFDTDSGQCSNFRADPQVVVIMPEPVDYFRGCGMTTYCRTKCAGNWEAFQEAVGKYKPEALTSSRELERSVDSLFFPSVVADMIAPGQVVALVRPDACGSWVCRDVNEDCLAVAAVAQSELQVSYYCVPSSPASIVYRSDVGALYWASNVGHDASKVSFVRNDGSAMAVLVGNRIVLLRRELAPKIVMDVDLIMSLPLVKMYPLRIMDFLAVRERLLVNVAVRTSNEAAFERDVGTLWFDPFSVVNIYADMSKAPPASSNLPEAVRMWRDYQNDLFPSVVNSPVFKDLWRGYAASEYVTDDPDEAVLIFWPTTSTGTLRRVLLTWTNTTVIAKVEVIEQSKSLAARATMMPRRLVLSKTLREDVERDQIVIYASAGNVYDWMRQLRLSGSGLVMTSASLSNAQPVSALITVNTTCDGLDCRGCPDLTVRSLCSAYQSCAVFRCIGTPVNLKRPLCGMGQVLRSLGNMGVTNVQGAWVMFVDIFMIMLQLKTVSNIPGVDVEFPDDSFMGNMCAAKDLSAEFFSILTATVNSILQRVQGPIGLFTHFSSIDASVNTLVSTSMAAITGFLHQIALAPVYVLSVGHKIMMCQVSGFLAVTSASGTRINIQSARFSSTDAISSQCLTMAAEVNAQQTGDNRAVKGMTAQAADILTGSGQAAVMRRLEPYMHMVDGCLTYVIGVVAKLADVLQTTDVQHCILPDVTLRNTVRCACGDLPLGIIPQRKNEGLSDFAYWCTGTLGLVDGDNRVRVVWNPYSYGELQAKIGDKLDAYVTAASNSSTVVAPNDPVFEEQGVSMFAVFTRCRQNYVNKQWDPMAFVRYFPSVAEREVRGAVGVTTGDKKDGVGQCLLDSVSQGVGNGACLDNFLRVRGIGARYWGYDVISSNVSSNLLDSCLVFSGPASNEALTDAHRKPFQNCLGGYANQSVCDLSGFVWSPASSNDVPVAVRHAINAGNESHLQDAIESRMRAASEMVMAKLRALSDYSNDQLRAVLFSAEGDVIHQLMDCVFMGPYARMDYWPVPRCDENVRDDCLVGPYWSRDLQGGKTRSVDASQCDAAGQIPFTCGSPTRKAMVRDFVKQYLESGKGGAEVVSDMVREWIANQTMIWWDPTSFYCDCEGCCDGNLPTSLSAVSLQISTKGIMNALEERLKLFYKASMRGAEHWISELAESEIAKYNWTTSSGVHQVETHGAYHPSIPTQRYDNKEAMSPPLTYVSPALWVTCHSALKQLMFTMPVMDDGRLTESQAVFEGGGVEAISLYVKNLMKQAKEKSPLYRHYAPRHHPSESRMCEGSATKDARQTRGSVRFSDYSVRGHTVFNGSSVPPIPTLAYDAAVLGGRWQGSYMGLTEHLGFLGREATERWLSGEIELETSAETLLRYGPGGLKLGNLPGSTSNLSLPDGYAADLDVVLREQLREENRRYSVESSVLHGCDAHHEISKDFSKDFVDGLFPMAQGVRESGVGSYCLRFAIELAMLHAMEMEPELDVADVVEQKELVVAWRRKCGTQVQLVGMCNALDMYHDGGLQTSSCLMSWSLVREPGIDMYITPECLVKIGDAFYDPCQCRPEWCEMRNTTLLLRRDDLENTTCRMGFDPRKVVQSAELGWWAEDETDATAVEWNAWLEDPVNLLDLDALRRDVIEDGQAVGNTPLGMHWYQAEGFMNETGVFCDLIADYWPEDSNFPVGYHVTTPCHADDTGYRSFDNVFAQDTGPDGEPRLVFLEDQTRDADLVDSHFGAGGLCRGTNFGFDMYETNTMRLCTRLTDGEDVDVHVPRGKIYNEELGLPRCSTSSSELPWGDSSLYDFYDAAFFSIGTVPNLPSQYAELYPEDNRRYMHVGPQHVMTAEGWGDHCQDFTVPNCSAGAWQCPEGFVCRSPGVCQHSSVQCTRHSECDTGKMCSGLGTCEVPRVSVKNNMGDDVSVRAHTTDCPGESFSMRGASYWGYVPDVLEAHGMCSYRHWREYLFTMQMCQCSSQDGDTCLLQADKCPFYTFANEPPIVNKWWNNTDKAPSRLKMIPTTCDRNYERFSRAGTEMKSCVPREDQRLLLNADNTYQYNVQRDKMWKMYDEDSKRVSLRLMPNMSQRSTGFLSGLNVDNIKSCMSIQQCYVDEFTKSGKLSMHVKNNIRVADRTLVSGAQYDADDQFKCGVAGYYDSAVKKCRIDVKLFPIYYVMCKETPRVGYQTCMSSLKPDMIPAKCDSVSYEYDPDYGTINDINVPALDDFFYIFSKPKTLAAHLDLVECVKYIYGVMSAPPFESKGLYVHFAFTLYEIPFPWFYQCMIGSSMVVPLALNNKLFPCAFYTKKNEMSTYVPSSDGFYTDFQSYIFNVRGGYERASLYAALQQRFDTMRAAWDEAIEEVRLAQFGNVSGGDMTYPQCYSEMHWDLPNSDPIKRKMIEAFVRSTCATNLLNRYIQIYNTQNNKRFNAQSVIYELVTLKTPYVNQGNVLASNKLLTGLIKNFGLDILTQNVAIENVNIDVTPIKVKHALPLASSAEFLAAKSEWVARSGILPNQLDVTISQLPNLGELKTIYDSDAEDTDMQAGYGTRVKTYSVYATGFFACFYPSITFGGVTKGVSGNNSNIELQFREYADLLYDEVRKRYESKMDSRGGVPIQMNELPFYTEESSLGFSSKFTVDLRGVANYINNINPDVRMPVMCVAGKREVNFNECSDNNFAALKKHVSEKYQINGGVVVPDRSQLDWYVDKAMMQAGSIFSFASTNRNVSKQYLARLFDEDSVCGATATLSARDRLCYMTIQGASSSYQVIAPWLGGWWNPYDKCDVNQLDLQSGNAETIDSLCYLKEFCPDQNSNQPYYQDMPNRACKEKDNQRTSSINVNSRYLYNLCRHTLNEDSICNHTQGVIGGSDGFPSEDYDVGGNLFTLHDIPAEGLEDGRLFYSSILRGGASNYGFIRIGLDQIGGHHIGLSVDPVAGLRVSKLPLKSVPERSRMAGWDTAETKDWMPAWTSSIQKDDTAYARSARDVAFRMGLDARQKPRFGWDCPLRRRAFYSGGVRDFKPSLPSARRSRMLFGSITNELWAHPTQARRDGSDRFGNYMTTNGFCFCPIAEEVWPGMCSVDTHFKEEHNCSLYNTIKALRGEKWAWSHTFRPRNKQNEFKTCGVQVDWPFVEGVMRDNSTIGLNDVNAKMWSDASDVETQKCHVLDRMLDFAYAYVSRNELRRSGFTTLERGVCHTGRVQKRLQSSQRCVRSSKNPQGSTLLCTDNAGRDVPRPASKSPVQSAEQSRLFRRLCGKCTRPPKFVTRNGNPIPAESSFGVPYRASVERVLARDLREALCRNKTSCDSFLNESAWRAGEFIPALLGDPRRLFAQYVYRPEISSSYEPRPDKIPDDSKLWAKKWVYCPTREALKTGQNCNGSISKAMWRKNKVGVCYATILESIKDGKDPFAVTDICNLDSRLTELCVTIREAQSLVASANCLRSGDEKCALQEFVYNPSTWESTNQAFVHQTVQEFYTRIHGCTSVGACPVCPADPLLQQLRRNNTYRLRECKAVPVMAFREVLIQLREMVFTICKILSLVIDIAFNLVLSMSSGARDKATSSIVVDWAQLKQESSIIVDKVSDMFFDMIFNVGAMGPWLKSNFMGACEVVNSGYKYAADFWCSLVVHQLPYFLGAIKSISGWMDVGFSVVNDVFKVILDDQLPNAVMDLYQYGYREYFQSNRYREKQAAYEERKELGLVNSKQKDKSQYGDNKSPAYNKLLQNLGEARERRLNRRIKDSAINLVGSLGGVLGTAGALADAGMTIYQTYQMIGTALQIKEMLEKFPTSFTLFDFESFYLGIDGLVEFLNSDFTCYSMSIDVAPLQCTLLNFTEPSADDIDVIAPRASVCWADAQQRQVGVSNLYACTATSTCCSDPLNCDDNPKGVRLCSECPLPPAGVRTYGCNTMLQRCQCGVESFQVDRCASQRDCGPSASCSLLTSLDDVSFGALKTCTECATSPVCLMGSSQQYGQCSCLTSADTKVDLCSSAVGSRVNPDVSKLCGFARDGGGYYAWAELSLVLCANAIAPVCAEVVSEVGGVIYMSVSTKIRNGQVAYSSRRLLSVDSSAEDSVFRLPSAFMPDDPADDVTPEIIHKAVMELEWNHTSTPCSSLVHAYRDKRPLGPVDEATLHSCVYWRSVGRQLIQEHKLEALRGIDTFLLSLSDFSASIGQHGVLREMLSNPLVLFHAALYSPWVKPVRAALVASHDANVSAMIQGWSSRMSRRARSDVRKLENMTGWDEQKLEELFETDRLGANGSAGPRRRLMGVWEETRDRIRALPFYSMIKRSVSDVTLSETLDQTASQMWLVDAFVWKGVRFEGTCPIADSMSSLVRHAIGVSRNYYVHLVDMNTPVAVRRRFRDVLPVAVGFNASIPSPSRPVVFGWIMDFLGLSVGGVAAFLRDPCPKQDCVAANKWTASYIVESLVFCDLESVMFCPNHKNDMVMSAVFLLVVYVCVSWLCGYLGLYGVSTAFFVAMPLLVVWYSIGVSPRCFPMIPTCLLDDLIAALKTLFPKRAVMPALLVTGKDSLRTCSELNFTSWEDPLAFAVCDLGFCGGMGDTKFLGVTNWRFGTMREMAYGNDADAYRVCASVTATYSVPVVMALTFVVAVAAALVLSLVSLISPFVGIFWQVVMFNHAENEKVQ